MVEERSSADARTGPASVDEPITVEACRAEWPHEFEREAARIAQALGAEAIRIEHIGSTAVKGLAAKPVIDVMVGVSDLDATAELARRVAILGYEDCGGDPERRYFRKRDGQHFNVQVIEYKSAKWRANLVLRDYLRTNHAAAHRYAEAKRRAAGTAPTLLTYSILKSPIIEQLLTEAEHASS